MTTRKNTIGNFNNRQTELCYQAMRSDPDFLPIVEKWRYSEKFPMKIMKEICKKFPLKGKYSSLYYWLLMYSINQIHEIEVAKALRSKETGSSQ